MFTYYRGSICQHGGRQHPHQARLHLQIQHGGGPFQPGPHQRGHHYQGEDRPGVEQHRQDRSI